MNTVLLLSEGPVSLQRLEGPLRALAGSSVYYTSPARLAVERGADFAAVFVDDGILDDYDPEELQERGIDPRRVHAAAIEFRRVELLRDVLVAVQAEVGVAWVDDDAGGIVPIGEAVRRFLGLRGEADVR